MANQGSVLEVLVSTRSGAVPARTHKTNKIPLTLLGLVVLAAASSNGCAGVVGAVPNHSNTGGPGGGASQPALSASPMSASFPNVSMGSSSSQTITLSNGGSAGVTVSAAAISGAGFSSAGLTVPITIAPGQNVAFNLVFTPVVGGNASGSIALTSNAPTSPLTIGMTGSATTPSYLLTANVASLSFGDVLVGDSSSLSATLTNAGNANITISGVSESGAGFTLAGVGANTILTPGQTAVLSAGFAPTAAGSAAASVVVNSNGASPVVIALSGNGVQASTHTVALTWDPSTSDVVGYYVYRGAPNTGVYVKLNAISVVNPQFTDTSVVSGQSYGYVVTAVDANNVESLYSQEVQANVP